MSRISGNCKSSVWEPSRQLGSRSDERTRSDGNHRQLLGSQQEDVLAEVVYLADENFVNVISFALSLSIVVHMLYLACSVPFGTVATRSFIPVKRRCAGQFLIWRYCQPCRYQNDSELSSATHQHLGWWHHCRRSSSSYYRRAFIMIISSVSTCHQFCRYSCGNSELTSAVSCFCSRQNGPGNKCGQHNFNFGSLLI